MAHRNIEVLELKVTLYCIRLSLYYRLRNAVFGVNEVTKEAQQGCIVRISPLIFRKLSRVTRSLFMRVRHKIEEDILLLYHFR